MANGSMAWPRAMPSCQKLFAGFAAVASAGRHLLAAATKRSSGVRVIAFGHVRLGCSGSERKPEGDRSSPLLALHF